MVEQPGRRKGSVERLRLVPGLATTGDVCVLVQREGSERRQVQYGPFGYWHCTCPAYEFGKVCAHVRAVAQVLALAGGGE